MVRSVVGRRDPWLSPSDIKFYDAGPRPCGPYDTSPEAIKQKDPLHICLEGMKQLPLLLRGTLDPSRGPNPMGSIEHPTWTMGIEALAT